MSALLRHLTELQQPLEGCMAFLENMLAPGNEMKIIGPVYGIEEDWNDGDAKTSTDASTILWTGTSASETIGDPGSAIWISEATEAIERLKSVWLGVNGEYLNTMPTQLSFAQLDMEECPRLELAFLVDDDYRT